MTMLTSLKALLFPTPAQTGVKGDAMPVEGSAGFAHLLNSVGTTERAAAQPAGAVPPLAADAGIDNKTVKYQYVNDVSWHPALTGTTAPLPSSPDIEQPNLPVQLAVALPAAEEASATTTPGPTPAVATEISAPSIPETAAEPPLHSVLEKDAGAPIDPVPVADMEAPRAAAPIEAAPRPGTALDDLLRSDEALSTDSPLPEQADGAVAMASIPTMAIAPTPVAPMTVEPTAMPAPDNAHPVRPHATAPIDAYAPSRPVDMSGAPDTDEGPGDDASPVGSDDGQSPARPTIAVMTPSVPVAAPVGAPPAMAPADPLPTESVPVAVAGPSVASRPLAAPTFRTQPASDASVETSARVTVPEADGPSDPATGLPVAAPSPAEPVPMPAPHVASAPAVRAASSLPAEAATASVDMAVDMAEDRSAILQPVAAPVPDAAPAPEVARPAGSPASTPLIQAAGPLPVAPSVPESVSAQAVATPTAEAGPAASGIASVTPALAKTPDQAAIADQVPALAQAAPPAAPAKPRAEAVSLLQLVRDHMSLRAPRRGETVAPVRDAASVPDTPLTLLPPAVNDSAAPLAAPVQPAAQPVATVAPAIPTVDLSASLGAQVVDMGVSGQWIDGLARDIAGLSANGAQGRFQIRADQLGPIQVDIRQGEDGAAISLTVATEAAEQALRQDSDRLKLDASLSAVRISEVKIERASQPTESARADSITAQNSAQQQSGGSNQNSGQTAGQGQNMGQSSAQSHMQGRGQQRENIALGHKAGNDGAVLNHMDAGDTAGGAVRARYA